MFAGLIMVATAAALIGGYAFARSGSTPRASSWFDYVPLAHLASVGHHSGSPRSDRSRAALSHPAAGASGVVVPHVAHADLGLAYARLHRAGLRVSFPGSFSEGDAPDSPCLPTIGGSGSNGAG